MSTTVAKKVRNSPYILIMAKRRRRGITLVATKREKQAAQDDEEFTLFILSLREWFVNGKIVAK